jgi:hypothetical protein
MTQLFATPYIAKGSGEIVFFLIILIWIIGGLMKKAADASKRSSPQGSAKPQRPGRGPAPAAPRPSLSDFLRRIRQMTGQGEEPPAPPHAKPEAPTSGPVLRMPSPPPRPPERKTQAAGPSVLPTPSLKREMKGLRVAPRAEMELPQRLEPIEGPVAPLLTQESPTASPPEPQEPGAYGIRKAHERPATPILGVEISTGEMKKGIILSEILGPPKAIRHRRHLAGGR